MVSCSVYGCNHSNQKNRRNGTSFTFHVFPHRTKSPVRYAAWASKTRRKNFVATKHSTICSAHFTKEDYEKTQILKKQLMPTLKFQGPFLKKSAVPSIFPEIIITEAVKKRTRKGPCYVKIKEVKEILENTAFQAEPFAEMGIQCEMGTEVFSRFSMVKA